MPDIIHVREDQGTLREVGSQFQKCDSLQIREEFEVARSQFIHRGKSGNNAVSVEEP